MQEVDFEVELIIADDASTDRTGEIVQSFIDSHPRGFWIKYTRYSVNKGMMGDFIWAMNQCKGEYIALCEGDDFWTELMKLKKQVDFLAKNQDFSLVSHVPKKFLLENQGSHFLEILIEMFINWRIMITIFWQFPVPVLFLEIR